MDWPTVAVLATLISGLGFALDRFLLKRQKGRLYGMLENGWIRLADTSVPRLPQAMAHLTLKAANSLFGAKRIALRTVVVTAAISMILTVNALILGAVAAGYSTYLEELLDPWFLRSWEVWAVLVPYNILFDVPTVYITLYALQRIAKGNTLTSLVAITADLLAACVLALMCLFGVILMEVAFQGGEVVR